MFNEGAICCQDLKGSTPCMAWSTSDDDCVPLHLHWNSMFEYTDLSNYATDCHRGLEWVTLNQPSENVTSRSSKWRALPATLLHFSIYT